MSVMTFFSCLSNFPLSLSSSLRVEGEEGGEGKEREGKEGGEGKEREGKEGGEGKEREGKEGAEGKEGGEGKERPLKFNHSQHLDQRF